MNGKNINQEEPKKSSVAGEVAKEAATRGFTAGAKRVGAKVATKLGIKAAAHAIGQTLSSAAPIIGNIATFLATELGPKILGAVKKALSKIGDFIFGKRDKRESVAIMGGLLLAGGLFLGSTPLIIAGGLIGAGGLLALMGGVAIGTGIAAYFTAFFLAITAPARAIATALIAAIIVIPLVVAFIVFIINSGAYVVPQGPPSVSALVENPYISVEKAAKRAGTSDEPQAFLEFENSNLPVTIEYTITVTAKRATLTNITFGWRCTVIRDPDQFCPAIGDVLINGESAPNLLPPASPSLISPANPYIITYTQLFRSVLFNDSLVIDTFTVAADVESESVTQAQAVSSASIRIGDPPDQCPQGWPVGGRFNQGAYTGSTHSNAEAIDIGANTGTPVSARHSGVARVESVATGGPFGNNVEIISVCPNDPFFSRYAHFSSTLVNTGDFVTLGQTIGEVGDTGNSFGSHLHYEFRGPSGPKGLGNPPNMLKPYIPQNLPRGCVGFAACGSIIIP